MQARAFMPTALVGISSFFAMGCTNHMLSSGSSSLASSSPSAAAPVSTSTAPSFPASQNPASGGGFTAVSGTVRDVVTRQPIAGATLSFFVGATTVQQVTLTTDADGEYSTNFSIPPLVIDCTIQVGAGGGGAFELEPKNFDETGSLPDQPAIDIYVPTSAEAAPNTPVCGPNRSPALSIQLSVENSALQPVDTFASFFYFVPGTTQQQTLSQSSNGTSAYSIAFNAGQINTICTTQLHVSGPNAEAAVFISGSGWLGNEIGSSPIVLPR